MTILGGDIGGTKTHLALFEESSKWKILKEEKYHSSQFSNLSEILHLFLASHPGKVKKACLGIAGPIEDGRCQATNLPWVIDARTLSKDLNIPLVWLLNDLEANAYGLRCLEPHEFCILNEGDVKASGNQALIAAGTGLGEAGLYWDGEEHHPFACEGGHTDFAPRDEDECDLWRYFKKRFDHVSYERVISGPGFYQIYRFLIETGKEKESDALKRQIEQGDSARVITQFALEKKDKACLSTLDWFISLYGSEAGNLALKFLALGGVYIGGGIAPKILTEMKKEIFIKAFLNKGRFSELLSKIPVKVILNENTALLGTAYVANRRFK